MTGNYMIRQLNPWPEIAQTKLVLRQAISVAKTHTQTANHRRQKPHLIEGLNHGSTLRRGGQQCKTP